MRLRFPKAARLTRSSEFARTKREGTAFHGKYLILSVLKDLPEDGVRAGFITSRRVGGAVTRNAIRRRLREIVRQARPQLRSGIWLVCVARPYAARASFQQLQAEWWQLARRSGIVGDVAPCSS